ncbi:MAG TPA: hypothetical protein VM819_11825 [Vicinamibacterales bacterium]|nr:hypothetical protein [Vicinamibacterales bacterium]
MNRAAIVVAALVTFVLAVAVIILGQNLILPLNVAAERGAGVPWYLTWAMVWVTVLCAVALGGFLIASTVRKK